MKTQNTAIIGAGVIGLYLSLKLAEKRHQVTLFEKKERIGRRACSGLFSERILKFIPESQKLIQNKIASVLIHFPRKSIKIKFSEPFLVMKHEELDCLMARLAEQAGVKIKLNYNFSRSNLEQFKGEFDRIVGCDGANSAVRKSLGLKEPNYRLGILGFVQKKDNSNYVETWAVPNGFIWRIPRGEETEYGIMAEPKKAKQLFEEFLEKNNLNLEKKVSAIISQGLIVPQNNKVTLCGDAVGLTKPWSGGGVVWGLIAAEIFLNTFPDFLQYQKKVKKYFRIKIFVLKTLTYLVYFLGFNFPFLLPKNIKIEGDAIFSHFIKSSRKNR